MLSSLIGPSNNDGCAIGRSLGWCFIRLPKHPILHSRRLVSRYERWTKCKIRSDIRHVLIIPHEQAVLVSFAESCRGEACVDAYTAIVCAILLAMRLVAFTGCGHKRGKILLLAVGSMCSEYVLPKPLNVQYVPLN